jgi:hypothetical protein
MTVPRKRPAERAKKVRPRQCRRFAALARRLTPRDVKVTFHDEGDFGQAKVLERKIYVPRPTSPGRLQIYFHELGHVLDWQRHKRERERWSLSEFESRAEVYAFRMMRIAGFPSPSRAKREADLFRRGRREVSPEARAFVGLKGLDDVTIIIAHILAVQRIGYAPKTRIDRRYWSALLASVPNAKMQRKQPGFNLIRIDPSKPRGPGNIAWSRWPEFGPQIRPVPTEAEIEQQEAIKQAMIESGDWDDGSDYWGE